MAILTVSFTAGEFPFVALEHPVNITIPRKRTTPIFPIKLDLFASMKILSLFV
jgi:hypothetical protein